MKTNELILEVALILFNRHGESLVTSVDLANEMNISPGNLYYHYKGKQEVVDELYARFHAKSSHSIEQLELMKHTDIQTSIAYVLLISSIFNEFRFISRDTVGISERYPHVKPQLNKLLKRLHRTLTTGCEKLSGIEILDQIESAPEVLANNLLGTLLNNNLLLELSGQSSDFNQDGMETAILVQLLPYLNK